MGYNRGPPRNGPPPDFHRYGGAKRNFQEFSRGGGPIENGGRPKRPPEIREDDWECPNCKNINFKRISYPSMSVLENCYETQCIFQRDGAKHATLEAAGNQEKRSKVPSSERSFFKCWLLILPHFF